MNNSLQVKIEGVTYNVQPNCFINSPDGSFKVSYLEGSVDIGRRGGGREGKGLLLMQQTILPV